MITLIVSIDLNKLHKKEILYSEIELGVVKYFVCRKSLLGKNVVKEKFSKQSRLRPD